MFDSWQKSIICLSPLITIQEIRGHTRSGPDLTFFCFFFFSFAIQPAACRETSILVIKSFTHYVTLSENFTVAKNMRKYNANNVSVHD